MKTSNFKQLAFGLISLTFLLGSCKKDPGPTGPAGANGNVSTIIFPGNYKTQISGIGVYYPDGRETQRVGIIPDIEVKPTIEGIRKGIDEVLAKAIEIIMKEK